MKNLATTKKKINGKVESESKRKNSITFKSNYQINQRPLSEYAKKEKELKEMLNLF